MAGGVQYVLIIEDEGMDGRVVGRILTKFVERGAIIVVPKGKAPASVQYGKEHDIRVTEYEVGPESHPVLEMVSLGIVFFNLGNGKFLEACRRRFEDMKTHMIAVGLPR